MRPPSLTRLCWLVPLLLVAGLATETDPSTPEHMREAIFLQVFKRPPPKLPVSGYVLVVLDGATREKLPALLTPADGQVFLDGRRLLALLQPLLKPAAHASLASRMDAAGRIGTSALQQTGLAVSFDPRRFELLLDTPAELRGTRVSHLNPPPPDPFSVEAVRPAALSGFLNYNLKGSTRPATGGNARFTTATLALDGALNLRGWVLEGSVYGQSGQSGGWQRGDLRLVRDWPRQALRFTAGDLSYPVIGYQRMTGLLGIGLARDFALQPHVPTWRTGEYEFHLARPSEVKVWVNDSLVRTLRLPAGSHDLRGLNTAVGQNDVRLEIEDDAGRREAIEFSLLFNPVLLEQGRQTFSFNAGFRRQSAGTGYDLHRPMASASLLRGWTDRLTLGIYTQAEEARTLFGAQALQGFRFGTLRLDAAIAQTEPGPWDAGARLEMTVQRPRPGGLQAQMALDYLGRSFDPGGSTAESDTLGLRASVAAALGRKTTGRLSGSYIPARHAAADDSRTVSVTLFHRWSRHVQGSLSVRHRRTGNEPAETRVLFGLSVNFTRRLASFQAAKELETDTVTMRWDSGRSLNAAMPYGFAETRLAEDTQEHRGGIGYAGYRGQAELVHRQVRTETASGWQIQDETTLRAQGAIVYADGLFALSRPVAENFALIAGRHGLRDIPLLVDPDGHGGSRARSDRMGPAVVENLASYRLRELRVEPVNPPLGATPENTRFHVAPTYKSGVALRLGQEPQVIAIGRLVGEAHQPLAHLAIEVRRLDRPEEPPYSTFSNRNGNFQIPDARPGRYEIRPASPGGRGSQIVEIPATRDSLYRLGEILLPQI